MTENDIKNIPLAFDHKFKKVIMDKYELIDLNDNYKFTDKLQILHIDIEKCYNIWHNNNVKNYEKHDQIMIYLGALLCTENISEFSKCLKELPMDNNVKKDIENTNKDLNYDDDMMSWYSKERDDLAIKNGERVEAIKDARDEGFKDGINHEKIELAKKMKDKNMNIKEIAELTNLSVDEIKLL